MLSERDICQDILKDLKYMSTMQAVFAGESSPDIKHLFLDQLRSHQDLHTQFLRLVEQRGWYPRVPGDWAFNEPYTFQGGGAWQAPQGGAAWQQPQAGAWQAQASTAGAGGGGGGGTWQAAQPSGGSWPSGSAFQSLQQNLREQR